MSYFNRLAREHPELLKKRVSTSLPDGAQSAFAYDLEGAIRNLIDDALAAREAGLDKPAAKPLPQRIEQLIRHHALSYKGVPAPAPSSVPAPGTALVPVPAADFIPAAGAREVVVSADPPSVEATVTERDHLGRIHAMRFEGGGKRPIRAEITQRDELGKVVKVRYSLEAT